MMVLGNEGNYANVYGIVSANYSKLFSEKKFHDFINAKSIEEILVSLEGSEYEEEFKKIFGKELKIKDLELALKEHFMRIYEEISKKIPPLDKEALDLLFLEESKIKDIISILRKVHSSEGGDEKSIEGIGFTILDDDLVKNLLKARNVEDAIPQLRGTRYYEILVKKVGSYKESGGILPLENALFAYLVGRWDKIKEKVKEGFQAFTGMKIDALNLKIIIRSKLLEIDNLEDYMLHDGYYFRKENFEKMKKTELGEIVKMLVNTPYFQLINKAITEYKEKKSIVSLEVGLDKLIYRMMKENSLIKPLSIYSVISYLGEKEREVKDLHAIFIGKKYELAPEEIKTICQIFSEEDN